MSQEKKSYLVNSSPTAILEWSRMILWHQIWQRNTPPSSCNNGAVVHTLKFYWTICLGQPCQNLPKGVACQSAQCVRTGQEPGRITSPAWPGAPSCPWTSAQLWTGNKRWEISYKPISVLFISLLPGWKESKIIPGMWQMIGSGSISYNITWFK